MRRGPYRTSAVSQALLFRVNNLTQKVEEMKRAYAAARRLEARNSIFDPDGSRQILRCLAKLQEELERARAEFQVYDLKSALHDSPLFKEYRRALPSRRKTAKGF